MIHNWSLFLCLFILRGSSAYTFGGKLTWLNCKENFSLGSYIYDLETTDLSCEISSWTLSSAVSSTKTYTTLVWTTMPSRVILGGPNILGPSEGSTYEQYFERKYEGIPTHTFVSFTIIMWYFDDWISLNGQPGIQFYFDGATVNGPEMQWYNDFWSYEGGQNLAPGMHTEDLGFDHIKGGVSHSGSTLTFRVVSLSSTNSISQPFGFRELSLFFSNSTEAAPSICHISEEAVVTYDVCPCTLNQAQDANSICQNCATGCLVCFGVGANQCLLCNSGFRWDGSGCVPCHEYCQTCAGPTQNDCFTCNDGYYNYHNGTCSDSCLSPFKIKTGTKPVCKKPCNAGDFYFSLNQSCLSGCNSPFQQSIDVNGISYCSKPCKNSKDYFYVGYNKCKSTCPYPYENTIINTVPVCLLSADVTEDEFNEVTKDSNFASDVGGSASIATQVMSVFNSQSPSFISIGGLAAMLQYIRYLRISYPPKLRLLFLLLNSNPIRLSLDIQMPYNIDDKLPNEPLPDIFEEYNLDSNFLINYWGPLSSLLAILFGILILFMLKILTPRLKRVNVIIRKVLRIVQWNLPLIYFCGNFGSMEFFAVLELRTNPHRLDISLLSFIVCLIMLILSIVVILKTIYITINIRKILKQNPKTLKHEMKWIHYSILWKNSKEDLLIKLVYMALFLFRAAFCNIVVAGLDSYPLSQAIVLALSSFFMCLYLIVIQPMKEKLDFLQLLTYEGLLFVVNTSVLILAILDKLEHERYGLRVFVGNMIIKISSIFSTCAVVFTMVQALLIAIQIYKMVRALRKRGIVSFSQLMKYAFINIIQEEDNNGVEVIQDKSRTIDLDNTMQIFNANDSRLEAKISINPPPKRRIRRIRKPESPQKLKFVPTLTRIQDHPKQENGGPNIFNLLFGEEQIVSLETRNLDPIQNSRPEKILSINRIGNRLKRRKKSFEQIIKFKDQDSINGINQ